MADDDITEIGEPISISLTSNQELDFGTGLDYAGCTRINTVVIKAEYEQRLVELVNIERARIGAAPLKRNGDLDFATRYQARDNAPHDFTRFDAAATHHIPVYRENWVLAFRGLERVPVGRLYMANRLLGLPLPTGVRPTLGARLHYFRCLAILRWRWSMALARFAATTLSPLDGRLLGVIYGDANGRPQQLAWLRLKHGLRLFRHYGGSLPQVFRDRGKKFT